MKKWIVWMLVIMMAAAAVPAPMPAAEEAPAGEEEDPFDKIFSIFNHK